MITREQNDEILLEKVRCGSLREKIHSIYFTVKDLLCTLSYY